MSFRLLYTKLAVADIRKLDSVTKNRIKKKLELYQTDPIQYSKKLINSSLGGYRFRIGDYRIIFDLDDDNIVILHVSHRRESYRKK